MYVIGSTPLATDQISKIVYMPAPLSIYPWTVELYSKSGGLKKSFELGREDCQISNLNFELNLNGCGSGSMDIYRLDFPIDADDYIKVFYNGVIKYRAIVDTAPDPKGGTVQLIPYWRRLEECLYNHDYTIPGETVKKILNDIISSIQTQTGIIYNPAIVDDGSSATLNVINYQYEYCNKIINDLVTGNLSNRYWGVDANNFFFVKAFDTATAYNLFQFDQAAYSSVTYQKDFSGITATRYIVYKKDATAGQLVYVAAVGPVGGTENLTRRKDAVLEVPYLLSDADASAYALLKLQSQSYFENITINDIDITKYFPAIFNRIQVEDQMDQILTTIIDCEPTSAGWINTSIDTTKFVEGTSSVKFSPGYDYDQAQYLYNDPQTFFNMTEIGFMIQTNIPGPIITFNVWADNGITLILTTPINIPSSGVWYYYSFPCYGPIQLLQFDIQTYYEPGIEINIDRVQIYQYNKTMYINNIVQANFQIDKEKDKCDIILKNYDSYSTEQLFKMQAKIKGLESTQKI